MFRWYVINTYSGHENKVKANLEHRIISMNQAPRFRRVVVPTEQVIETKDGQKVQTDKRVLLGYVLVNMDLNDDAWGVVKNTPGVTGFVGAGNKPVPLSQPEVDRIMHTGAAEGARPRTQIEYQLGESVKVTLAASSSQFLVACGPRSCRAWRRCQPAGDRTRRTPASTRSPPARPCAETRLCATAPQAAGPGVSCASGRSDEAGFRRRAGRSSTRSRR